MAPLNRRYFLKNSGISLLPAMFPFSSVIASGKQHGKAAPPATPVVKFYGDGEMFEPSDYLAELQKAHAASPIGRDSYGKGGAVEQLEKAFTEITGKEKAIFLPTGTMANQLAIAVLSGENTKVFVQDTSHVYRDEGDAAQSIFGKRLHPLAMGQTYFTAQALQEAVENMPGEEVFPSGFGAVSIENPVRRTLGQFVPLDEIKKISAYCRSKGIKLHLDGARLYLASAWTGVPVKEWASYFDTVYISLYKYLGASAGAVLCGSKEVIDKMPHLMKVHGGNMYGNWTNAAMALHRLEGLEARLQEAIKRADQIFAALNKLPGMKIVSIPGGTNIYKVELASGTDSKKLRDTLRKEHAIALPGFNQNNQSQFSVNETLLYQNPEAIINAFKRSLS
jgi:threonine aldolase